VKPARFLAKPPSTYVKHGLTTLKRAANGLAGGGNDVRTTTLPNGGPTSAGTMPSPSTLQSSTDSLPSLRSAQVIAVGWTPSCRATARNESPPHADEGLALDQRGASAGGRAADLAPEPVGSQR
jgi:hypothetical protein